LVGFVFIGGNDLGLVLAGALDGFG